MKVFLKSKNETKFPFFFQHFFFLIHIDNEKETSDYFNHYFPVISKEGALQGSITIDKLKNILLDMEDYDDFNRNNVQNNTYDKSESDLHGMDMARGSISIGGITVSITDHNDLLYELIKSKMDRNVFTVYPQLGILSSVCVYYYFILTS